MSAPAAALNLPPPAPQPITALILSHINIMHISHGGLRWSEIPRGSKGKGKVAKAIDKVHAALHSMPPALDLVMPVACARSFECILIVSRAL